MPLRPLHDLHSSISASDDDASNDDLPSVAADQGLPQSVSRRRFLAGATATASVGLAGCSARLPGNAANIDSSTTHDGNTLIWNYPASAVQSDEGHEGIGYAAIQFRVRNLAEDADSVMPVLIFRLNSTVADFAAEASFQGYQADWFRFRIGVPRTYNGTPGLRAFVQPPHWPEIRTTYGYDDTMRELVVTAPSVNEQGTITVMGRFHPPGMTLPGQLHCGFEVQASQPGSLGRTVRADGRATFDVSVLEFPEGVTVGY